jgi:hypothetical protein
MAAKIAELFQSEPNIIHIRARVMNESTASECTIIENKVDMIIEVGLQIQSLLHFKVDGLSARRN